ncbi:MAG: hypothetical protein ABIH46_03460 [Chloroflexota bacterium]
MTNHTAARFWNSLAAETLRCEMVAQATVWIVARSADKAGQGCANKATAARALDANGIFKRSYVRQLLRQASTNIFYRIRKDRIWLNSPARVAFLLGCTIGSEVSFPIEKLASSRAGRRALFLAISLSPRDKPITRCSIRKITRVSKRTQRRYGRFGLWKATGDSADVPDAMPPPPHDFMASEYAARGLFLSGGKLRKRLPNTYYVNLTTGRRRSQSMQQQLRRLNGGHQPAPRDSGPSRRPPKIFYPSCVSYAKEKGNKPGLAGFNPWPTAINRGYLANGIGHYVALPPCGQDVMLWSM